MLGTERSLYLAKKKKRIKFLCFLITHFSLASISSIDLPDQEFRGENVLFICRQFYTRISLPNHFYVVLLLPYDKMLFPCFSAMQTRSYSICYFSGSVITSAYSMPPLSHLTSCIQIKSKLHFANSLSIDYNEASPHTLLALHVLISLRITGV